MTGWTTYSYDIYDDRVYLETLIYSYAQQIARKHKASGMLSVKLKPRPRVQQVYKAYNKQCMVFAATNVRRCTTVDW